MRILIGYDGSEHAGAALDDLKWAGLPRDSEVLVVSVADLLMSSPPVEEIAAQVLNSHRVAAALKQAQTHGERVIKEAEEFAAKAARRLRLEFSEWNISDEVIVGTPAWELIDKAKSWKADLILVGSEGRSALQRFFLGSVSKRVVTDSRCSVRVARRRGENVEDAPPRIIIGVDGSPAAEAAIYAVGQRVWQDGTEVRLIAVDDGTPPLHVVARLPQAARMIDSYFQTRKERVSAMLEWATNELNVIGLKTSILTEKGDPKDILLTQARKWNAHSIFVGTRDFKSGFERFRIGSVSTAVVTNAHCSVEVVRQSDEEQE